MAEGGLWCGRTAVRSGDVGFSKKQRSAAQHSTHARTHARGGTSSA